MQSSDDPQFFKLLHEISNNDISVDIIGIGQNLNIQYAEKIANIKNITINSAMKQEDIQKILVDDFEFNFFPVATDLKIEFLSHNLKILKCFGTGYKETSVKNSDLIDEKNLLFKNLVKESKTNLIIFNLLRKIYLKKYKRQSFITFQTVANFLKYNKKQVAQIDNLTRSEIRKENNCFKIQGNMILLKVEIEDLDLHNKLSQKELAEIIIRFTDCEDQIAKKVNFPIVLDFTLLKDSDINNQNASEANVGLMLQEEITKKKSGTLVNFIQPRPNSPSISIAIALYMSAKFLKKILKEAKLLNSNSLQLPQCLTSEESVSIIHSQADVDSNNNIRRRNLNLSLYFIKIQEISNLIANLEDIKKNLYNDIFMNRLESNNEKSIRADLEAKIETLFLKIYQNQKIFNEINKK